MKKEDKEYLEALYILKNDLIEQSKEVENDIEYFKNHISILRKRMALNSISKKLIDERIDTTDKSIEKIKQNENKTK